MAIVDCGTFSFFVGHKRFSFSNFFIILAEFTSKVLICYLVVTFLYFDYLLLTAPFIGSGGSLAGTLIIGGRLGCAFLFALG